MGLEIAEGRAGKESSASRGGDLGRQGKWLGEIGFHRQHREARMIAAQLLGLLQQHLRRDVDRHVGGDGRRCGEQNAHLPTRAATELD
jgi:hypothetical protein